MFSQDFFVCLSPYWFQIVFLINSLEKKGASETAYFMESVTGMGSNLFILTRPNYPQSSNDGCLLKHGVELVLRCILQMTRFMSSKEGAFNIK